MILVWLTNSLRLHDNPALAAAGDQPCLVAVDPAPALPQRAAAWRRRSLAELSATLEERGVPLLDASRLLQEDLAVLALRWGLREVRLDAGADPAGEALAARLAGGGVPLLRHAPSLAPVARDLLGEQGVLPRSFSAFQRRFEAKVPVPDPADAAPRGARLEELPGARPFVLTPAPVMGDSALPAGWLPGEAAALARLRAFLERPWPADPAAWERAGAELGAPGGSSGLSPWLARGDLGPRRLWRELGTAAEDPERRPLALALRRQLVWRDYALALLAAHPDLPWEPVSRAWRAFPSRADAGRLAAWREGRTGIPIVDAALRQLAAEGWIHNRLRMMAGTWLVKQMGQPWQEGRAVFEEWLVDGDPALNAMNWQWCAGCGVDAQPWFRLFSPEKQAERADPEGDLLRRWLPELAGLPLAEARRAWTLPDSDLAARGYPLADPDPAQGRAEALAAWARFRGR